MANVAAVVEESEAPREKTPKGWQEFWTREYDAAQKRQRKFLKRGNKIVNRYLDERAEGGQGDDVDRNDGQAFRLNLFYTNVSTLQSMLFGQTPKIDVSREFQDPDDDIARVSATILKRMLEVDCHPSNDDLTSVLRAALQDRLLPGLGMARVKYNMTEKGEKLLNPDTQEVEITQVMDSESCVIQYVHWQDLLWGWTRTWSEMPWLAYRVWMNKTEVTKRFGKTVAENLEYKIQTPSGDEKDNSANTDQNDNIEKAEIWEIWHKVEKKVFWFSYGADLILDSEEDPYNLLGFWPSPKPLVANQTTSLFMPKADFTMAQDLYNEVDVLQTRIAIITAAVRVVGVYDKNAGDAVGRMLKEGFENDLVPVDNWAMFAEKGGLSGTIDWFPLQDVVSTLKVLTEIRDDTIGLLYQITGMSDLLRGGSTDQYTSDGTNQLKAKFGSIRVQALQDEFARFASDLDGLKAEIVAMHFSDKTIAKQANLQFLPEPDHKYILPALELIHSPDIRWRVNIRPESVAMVDYAQLKQERSEFLTAMATYLQSAQAMAKTVPGSLPVLMEMLKWAMAGFKGSDYLEGIMDQAIDQLMKAEKEKAGQPPQEDPAMKLEQAKQQGEMGKMQAKQQGDMQAAQQKFEQTMQQQQQDHQQKMTEQAAKNQGDMQKIAADLQADLKVIMAKLSGDLQVEEAQSTMQIAEQKVDHAFTTAEQEQSHLDTLAEQDNAPRPTGGGSE